MNQTMISDEERRRVELEFMEEYEEQAAAWLEEQERLHQPEHN